MVRLGRIPAEEVERLKKEVDLVALVRSKGVELLPHGREFIGRCPFHDDRTPSLAVSPEKNLWHCLGACQVGGSVIDWVMRCEGVSFRHALELIRAGDPKVLLSSEMAKTKRTTPKLAAPVEFDADDQTLLSQVVEYYHRRLKETPAALSYLEARGIRQDSMIDRFKIGFSDRTLGLRLPQMNRTEGGKIRSRLISLGVYRESGHEHFNGSVVIPIWNSRKEITEIYGRKITSKLRAGTPLHTYLPGPRLRGVWNGDALKTPEIILCESLIDALTFYAHGFTNVTTSYGINGFTEEMLTALVEHGVKRVLIAYDRDAAGDGAAVKLASQLQGEGIECRRILFPKGMDANEYALKVQPAAESLQVAIQSAVPMGAPKTIETKEADEGEEIPSSPLAASLAVAPSSSEIEESAEILHELTRADRPLGVDQAVEVRGEDIYLKYGEREYRVRGLAKNLAYEILKVNIRASIETQYHVDTLDLYQAKARTAFIAAASRELQVKDEVIKRDLGRVLYQLEMLQDEEIKKELTGREEKKRVELTDVEREAALSLLQSPDLIKRILSDFKNCGVIGEETNLLTGYLASISRKLDEPLAVIIQSQSAAGKTSLMDAVLAMVPEEDKVKYSAMTGQSLFYMGEVALKNKILAIAEEEGARQASYALKLLQSEGEISIASTGKDPQTGKLVTHQYRVEGPVMIFLTTTAIEIDEELLNRCLVLTVNETREQTRLIQDLQRKQQTIAGLIAKKEKSHILKLHQNAQRLLRPVLVANPFAEKLTFLSERTRTRRDHMKYLGLIRAIALLHQYQRKTHRTEHRGEVHEYIEVDSTDIEAANALAETVLGRGLDELPPQSRRLLFLLNEMAKMTEEKAGLAREDFHFTRRDVRGYTGWSDYQVLVHLSKLSEMEYVIQGRGGRSGGFLYQLADVPERAVAMGLTLPGNATTSLCEMTHGFSGALRGEETSEMGIETRGSPELRKNDESADKAGLTDSLVVPYAHGAK